MPKWKSTRSFLAPEGVIVKTKIDDAKGVRNVQQLKRVSNLWFTPDGKTYVYYTPTHWREVSRAEVATG